MDQVFSKGGARKQVAFFLLLAGFVFSVQTAFAYPLDPGIEEGAAVVDGGEPAVSSGDNQFVAVDEMDVMDAAMTDGSGDDMTGRTDDSSAVQDYFKTAQNYASSGSVYNSVYYASLAVAAGFTNSDLTQLLASQSQKLFDQAKDTGVAEMFEDYGLLANAAGVPDALKAKATVKLQLKRTITKLHFAMPVKIICVGSSSTQGYPDYGAATPSQTYPSQLQIKMQALYGVSSITVLNRGIGGATASSMIHNFATSVFSGQPDLVIWQTGTVEAMNKEEYSVYLDELKTGTLLLANHGFDVALLDSQYFPGFGETDLYRNYVSAMDLAAKQANIPVFHRYDYMRQLVQSGTYSWNSLLNTDQFHPSAFMHQLTAQYIADLLR